MRASRRRVECIGVALGALSLSGAACQSSATGPRGRPAAYSAGGYAAPAHINPVAATNAGAAEGYGLPQAQRQLGSAWLFLPGSARQQQVQFTTVNGRAVLDGDIMLGPATALLFRYGVPWQSTLERKGAVAVASRSYLWPEAEIPYVIDASAEGRRAAIQSGIDYFRGSSLRIRPRTAADSDYVVFRQLGEGCWSYLGRQGGAQDIDVTGCGSGSVAHELMHAAGFYHEQSRGDRDDHVTIMWDEIAPEVRFNFEKRDARGQDIGPYDYGSIMHYSAYAGSRLGNPTIIPRVPNTRIGQREGLSDLDRAAIESLYGRASASTPPPAPASVPVAAAPQPPPVIAPPVLAPPSAPPPSTSPAVTSAPPAPAPAPSSNGSYAGVYGSNRGTVTCSQGGLLVQCQYPEGTLFCAASGPELACTWSGGGQGRATFRRQPSGVLAGVWGSGFSTDDRGRWDLTPSAPASGTSPMQAPSPAAPVPGATAPAAVPAPAPVSLTGHYDSTRGRMSCVDSGSSLTCNFQEADGVSGRLDCATSPGARELSCAWITFLPRPGTGRASFTRPSPTERRLTGTWGFLLAPSGGGTWDARGL